MSNIIERAFNRAQKIKRAVFKGAPNLFTTSDLNRQFESIGYQIDTISDRIGVISDISLKVSVSDYTWTVTPSYTYLEAKGLSFSPSAESVSLYSKTPVFLCLTADISEVTYTDDFSHEIAGATFADNTSAAAANQLVYKDETFVITADPSSLENLVAVISKSELDKDGNIQTMVYALSNRQTLQDYVAASMSPLLSRLSALEGLVSNRLFGVGYMMLWNRNLRGKVSLESVKEAIPYGFVPCHRLSLGETTYENEFSAWSEYVSLLGFTITMRGSGTKRYIDFSAEIEGVPLMDGRMPMGASSNFEFGGVGGSSEDYKLNIALTEENLPAHTHVYSTTTDDDNNTLSYTKNNGATGSYNRYEKKISDNVGNGSDGNDNSTAAYETTPTGSGKPLNYSIPRMPPYMAMYFIIRVSI